MPGRVRPRLDLIVVGVLAVLLGPNHLLSQASGGKGQVTGQVLGDDGAVVEGATVKLRRENARDDLSSLTDREGRFAFRDLAPGWYGLVASKAGFATLAYGARRTRDAGMPLVVSDRPGVSNLAMRLPRTAVLSGAVRRPDGTPLGAINVAVLERTITAGGLRATTSVASAMTNEKGEFRIAEIPPGSYVLEAMPVRAPISAPAAVDPKQPPVNPSGYAATYYPSATNERDAAPLMLSSGERKGGADILVRIVQFGRIQGRVLDETGGPSPNGQVQLIPFDSAGAITPVAAAAVQGGLFVVSDVPPGEYLARAIRPAAGSAPELRASSIISMIEGANVSDLNLLLRPSATVSGHMIFDGDSTPPPAAQFRLGLYEAADAARAPSSTAAATVRADGTFVFSGVEAGRYSVRIPALMPTSGSWSLVSVLINQQDVIDAAFEIGAGQRLDAVRVTATDRLGQLSGTIADRAGAPATEFTIVVFPDDKALWSTFRRRVFATRPANTGEFRIDRMPPGRYRVAAVRDAEPNEWLLPEFLETLLAASVPVSVAYPTPATLNLVVNR